MNSPTSPSRSAKSYEMSANVHENVKSQKSEERILFTFSVNTSSNVLQSKYKHKYTHFGRERRQKTETYSRIGWLEKLSCKLKVWSENEGQVQGKHILDLSHRLFGLTIVHLSES